MITYRKELVQLLLAFICLLFLYNCSNSYTEDIKRGGEYNYEPGLPELWFEPTGTITPSGEAKMDIAGTIPRTSLIYKEVENELKATIEISIKIHNNRTDKSTTDSFTTTIAKNGETNILNNDLYTFRKEYEVESGDFEVSIMLLDKASGKMVERTTKAFIPTLKEGQRTITNIRLMGKQVDSGFGYVPITTYDVNKKVDSLKFIFQVSNLNSKRPNLTFNSRLIKFKSDTTIATSLSSVNRSASSIEYKGIDLRDFEIIQSTKRELSQTGNVTVEYAFENLSEGNYRFEVGQNLEDEGPLYKARDFSIKGENYPAVKSPKELAEPLVYLMDKKEYEELISIKNKDSIKAAVDRFWLTNIQNSSLAKSIISMYYHRVEEANKLFSNFKEGWKTDMGMTYILLGPPLFQNKKLNEMIWSYSYDLSLPEYNFLFLRNKSKSAVYPFDHYVLQRDNVYFQIEYRARELWLTGKIMTATL